YDEKHKIAARAVEHLMSLAGGDVHSFVFIQRKVLPFHLEYSYALDDKKELLRLVMIVAHLRGPGRHALVDDAQLAISDQVPAITVFSPRIVLGGLRASYHLAFQIGSRFSSHARIPSCASSVFISSSR